jgi:hypothetical protein
MEHPLIGDISHLTEDELLGKVNDLNRKLVIAARSGNGHLCDQLRMAIETYQNRYRSLIEAQSASSKNSDFSDRIRIE